MQERARGGSDRMMTHPIDWLLNKRPCPDMGAFSWRQAMVGNALLWGNAYSEIERDNRGVPIALWPIHPYRVTVEREQNGLLAYRIANERGANVTLAQMDVFHMRGFGDGPVGYNVIEYAAQSIGWAQATETFGASYFNEGMNPTGVLQVKHGMSPEAMELLRLEMKRLYTGTKAEKTAILDAGIEFSKISNDPEQGQFTDVRQHQVEEICRWFGVPPHKVQHLLRATFSNIEHQAIEVVVDTITPWVKILEQEADYKLFGQNRQGLFSRMKLEGLLRGDTASRATFYKTMFELGMSMNEIRALEDLNSVGPDGDERFVSNNVQPLKRALAEPEPQEPDEDEELSALEPPRANGQQLPN